MKLPKSEVYMIYSASKKKVCMLLFNFFAWEVIDVGKTNMFDVRLNEHNRVRGLGAYGTYSGAPWTPLIRVYGFKTDIDAYSFEYALKKNKKFSDRLKWLYKSLKSDCFCFLKIRIDVDNQTLTKPDFDYLFRFKPFIDDLRKLQL